MSGPQPTDSEPHDELRPPDPERAEEPPRDNPDVSAEAPEPSGAADFPGATEQDTTPADDTTAAAAQDTAAGEESAPAEGAPPKAGDSASAEEAATPVAEEATPEAQEPEAAESAPSAEDSASAEDAAATAQETAAAQESAPSAAATTTTEDGTATEAGPTPADSGAAAGPADPGGDMEALLADRAPAADAQAPQVGSRVSGVVVRVGEYQAFVDYGGRSEGVIGVDELRGEDGEIAFQAGDPIEAFIVADSGEVALSRYPSGEARQSDLLYKAFKSGQPVEGTVMAVNKWGLGVSLEGLRAFCPVSQIDTAFTEDPERFRNQTMAFKIIRFRDRGRSIVLSRRALLEAEQAKGALSVRESVTEGAELTGSVTRLENFGAFVDLGARVEGLIHVSELRHERVSHPQDVVQPGQEVKVKVIAVKNLGDRRKERISLSLKALEKNPWTEARERFRAGSVVTGRVEALEDFGAFVELAPNVQGLIHVSEMARRRVNHPRDVLSQGEEVKVAILEIDDRRKRFRLSLKRAEQVEGEANLREFEERRQQEKEESPGNATMLEALKRAQLID